MFVFQLKSVYGLQNIGNAQHKLKISKTAYSTFLRLETWFTFQTQSVLLTHDSFASFYGQSKFYLLEEAERKCFYSTKESNVLPQT